MTDAKVDPPWLSQRLKDHGDTAEWIEDVARRRGITPEAMAAKVEALIVEQEAREARRKTVITAPPLPPAPESKPKPAKKKNTNRCPPYGKLGRELTAIAERIWSDDRECLAALYVLQRMAKAHKVWVAVGRRELAREIGCKSGQTAYDVLTKLVDDGILLRREPETRFDPKLKRRYADEYTFPRFGRVAA